MASFSKFVRPDTPRRGVITHRDLDVLDVILRYRFSSVAQIVRLVGGNEDVTHRRLRKLWEHGLVNRWALPGIRTHSELYRDETKAASVGWRKRIPIVTPKTTSPTSGWTVVVPWHIGEGFGLFGSVHGAQ